MVYFFYDSADMLENEVFNELTFGVKFCSQYIPERLRDMYLNKKGVLIIKKENLCHLIHPDDIKKYDKNLVVGNFICTNIESQYLFVRNEMISLRVLPHAFTIISLQIRLLNINDWMKMIL